MAMGQVCLHLRKRVLYLHLLALLLARPSERQLEDMITTLPFSTTLTAAFTEMIARL